MTLVVDATVAVEAALAGSWSGATHDEPLAAPSLLWSEAGSAVRQLEFRGEVRPDTAARALEWLRSSGIAAHPSSELIQEARSLAVQLGWAKTYDAEYVVLARRLRAPLLTIDARLRRSVDKFITVVGPLESWSSSASIEGRSEADLIREGIESVAAKHRTSEPTIPLFESGLPDLASRSDEYLEGFGER